MTDPTDQAPSAAQCAVHPDRDSVGTCEHCGAFSCEDCLGRLDGRLICRACVDQGRIQGGAPPWERREELGAVNAAWMTLKEVTFHPIEFFEKLEPEGPLGPPVILLLMVNLLTGLVGGIQNFFLGPLIQEFMENLTGGAAAQPDIPWLNAMQSPWFSLVYSVTVGPFMSLAVWFLVALLAHLGLTVVGGARHSINATIRVYLYGAVVLAWAAIPVLGLILGIPLGLYLWALFAIGLTWVHRTSWPKGTFAALWWLLLCCGCFFAAILLGVLGAALGA